MPALGGSGFYEKLRKSDKQIPVLVLSAVTDSEEIGILKQFGNPVCIEKSSEESRPEHLWWRILKLKVFGSRDLR